MFPAYSRPFEVILLFCAAACAVGSAQAKTGMQKPLVLDRQDIRFIPLSVNGVSLRARVWSIAQDNFGILWLGTSDGLYRYDGYSLKRYENERDRRGLPDRRRPLQGGHVRHRRAQVRKSGADTDIRLVAEAPAFALATWGGTCQWRGSPYLSMPRSSKNAAQAAMPMRRQSERRRAAGSCMMAPKA